MISVYMPICIDCKHLDLVKGVDGRPVCKAYPEGIPHDVWKEKSKPDYDKDTAYPNGCKF